jgi:multiple sugar transport system permease protein
LKKNRGSFITGIAFISPWIIGFLIFQFYPIYKSVYYGFCRYDVLNPPVFIGMDNYKNLCQDEIFLNSIVSTIIYTAMAVPLSIVVALFFAILLNQKIFGRGIFRTIYFLPSLVPILGLIGISGPNWLGSTMWATPSIVLTRIWGVGGTVVIYLAALQDVPKNLYEAAEIDGAGWFSKTRHVTLPLISPAIYFNLITELIRCLQVFAVPYIMTSGGPARSTYYYTMYLFDNAFSFLKMGYAGAMAVLLFIAIAVVTLIATKLSANKVYYAK